MMNFKDPKLIIIITLLQSFLLLYILPIFNLDTFDIFLDKKIVLNIIIFLSIGLSVLNIILIKKFITVLRKSVLYKIIEAKLGEQKEYIDKLHSQKHDFANHLQTIYTLIEFNKDKKALEYLDELSDDLSKLKTEENINNSALKTILLQKKKEAKSKGVKLKFELNLGAEYIDLSLNQLFRLIFNLVDNSIDAALESDNPRVKIKGIKKENYYLLSVWNNGKIIPEDMIEKIKNPAVSTKGSTRGYGVYIINNIINSVSGKLKIKSEENFGTEFKCYL